MSRLLCRALRFTALAAALAATGTAWSQSAAGLEHGASRVLRAEGRPMTAVSNAAPAGVVASFLRSRGRSDADLAATRTVRSARGAQGVTHLRLEQTVDGLAVHGAYAKAAVNVRGQVVHVVDNLAKVTKVRAATIGADAALRAAMDAVHPGRSVALGTGTTRGNVTTYARGTFFHRAPEVTVVAVPMSDGLLARGFLVETWTRAGNQLHHTLVGGDGRVLDVELRTNSDSYNVFLVDPAKSAGAQTVVAGPAPNTTDESPAGWLAGAQTTQTISGNNVSAYLDRDNDDVTDGGGIAAGDQFLAEANLLAAPTAGANGDVAVQNLFYLNNRIHDILYRHGFNEAAGNFQANNFARGGRASDPVQAQAQDGGGTDNANFATPGDGKAPRMQMYLWTGAGGTHQVTGTGYTFDAMSGEFGGALNTTGISFPLVAVNDGVAGAGTPSGTTTDGCEALPAGSLTDRIALVDRGFCAFTVKAANAQAAGARGVIVANNTAASPDEIFPMGGLDASISIPALLVSYSSGAALRAGAGPTTTMRLKAEQPLQIDAALDSDIVYHEYCHGLTWRMIGRMSGPLAGAIGEGMADVCALMINSDPTVADPDDVVAEYSASDPRGIRSARYTNHPRSYGTIGAVAGSPQVHFDGEIYAAIAWNMMQRFSTDPTIPTGAWRDRLFGYLVDGMNYTPAQPTYEEMRNGILAAVAASGNTADCAKVWDSFARYGVGVGAKGAVRGKRIVIAESFTSSAACN